MGPQMSWLAEGRAVHEGGEHRRHSGVLTYFSTAPFLQFAELRDVVMHERHSLPT